MTARREVIVVGGGQAGLAIGYFLAQQGRDFTILEAADTPAAAWRGRWDSLKLFTPVRYDSLPGLAFPGDPDSYPGRDDVVRYLEAIGLLRKTADSRIGRRLQNGETLIGSSPRSARRRHGIHLRPRAVGASGAEVSFSDGTRLAPPAVISATGFQVDHSWVDLPVFDECGRVVHERGITASPGLYFLGLQWQYTRGSALLGWVKDDAQHLAEHIAAYRGARPARIPA